MTKFSSSFQLQISANNRLLLDLCAFLLHANGKKDLTSWRISKTYLKAICILVVKLFFPIVVRESDLEVEIMINYIIPGNRTMKYILGIR